MITYDELVKEYRNWIFKNLVEDEMSRALKTDGAMTTWTDTP